ncbi:MAG: DNA polymerase IV, partial [Candidatus Micrarchaeaceae archaeon]
MLVIYVDMDSFFASCELLRHKEYVGLPLIIGTSEESNKERGVVQTCTYEARKFGIKSGMPIVYAYKLCPDLIYIASDENYYEEVSGKVFEILRSYGRAVEQYSIDEAALDADGLDYEAALGLGREIKKRILQEIGLKCTIGIAHGKYIAKMVCESAKPDGLMLLKKEEMAQFLAGKMVEDIPGVGPKTAERLHSLHINTVGDIAKADPQLLSKAIGSFGYELHYISIGDDRSKVVGSYKAVSISRERTLDSNTVDLEKIYKMSEKLADEVFVEVKKRGVLFKGIGIKVRYADFSY